MARPLTRATQLDMRGNPRFLRRLGALPVLWPDGLFWLVYTDVKRLDGNFKDAHNYIVTAPPLHRRPPLVGAVLRQFERLRPVAIPR